MIANYNGEMYRIPQAFEDEVRADERAKVLDEIDKILLDRFTCDDLRTDWTNADIRETIHFELEQLKERSNDERI